MNSLIQLLFLLNFSDILLSANIRLISFGCNDDTISIPVWKNPDQYTKLKELCSLSATIKGFSNPETSNIIENNFQPKEYQITVLLSFNKSRNLDLLSNVIKLDTISLQSQKQSSDGLMKISLDLISLPAVEFCGELYLIAVLQKINGLQVLQFGLLSIPIKIECNELFIDLVLSLRIPDIETIINFESDMQYMKVISNFQISKISENEFSLPNNMQFSIENRGNQTFKQRCGIFSLQMISFIIPFNDSDKIPIGTEKKEFDSLLKPNGKLLQYSFRAFIINNGKNLIDNKYSQCSPQIQPNEKLIIDMKYFKMNKLVVESLSEYSQLILIIDPLNTLNEQNLQNNAFILPLRLPKNRNLEIHECIVESNPFTNGNEAVIIHNSYKTGVSKSYSYYSLTKTLAENDFNTSIKTMTKYFWQNWIINRRVDQLFARNECPKELRNKPLVEQFSDFLLNARTSISRVSPKTQWQKNQIKKLFYILKTIRDSIEKFRSGALSLYNKEVLLTIRNGLKQMKSNKTMSLGLILEIIKDLVINRDPKLNETKIIVSKRIQKIFHRLSNDGINETIERIPELAENKEYIEDLNNIFKWIRENGLFTFDLPNNLDEIIIESINSPKSNVSELIQNCVKLSEKILKNNQMNERQKESTDLLMGLLKSSLDLGVWNSWLELYEKWKQIIENDLHLILIDGKYENIDNQSEDLQLFCKQEALNQLLLWKSVPDWLNLNYERETNPMTNNIGIEFRSKFNLIERSDFDVITGYKLWSIVFLCECSSMQLCSNNL